MAQTLRRSKSKYGRTRRRQRQQKKQTRMRGGLSFTDFSFTDLSFTDLFKPKTNKDKCKAAKEAAQTACSNVDGDIEMTEMGSEKEPTSQNYATTTSPYQDMNPAAVEELASNPKIMPLDNNNNNQYTLPLGGEQPLPLGGDLGGEQPLPSLPTQTVIGGSRRKKNKNNNKKRNQSRRKKTKSKKHKK